jgi:hypothetical protein
VPALARASGSARTRTRLVKENARTGSRRGLTRLTRLPMRGKRAEARAGASMLAARWSLEPQAYARSRCSELLGRQAALAAIGGELRPTHGRDILHGHLPARTVERCALVARRAARIVWRNTPGYGRVVCFLSVVSICCRRPQQHRRCVVFSGDDRERTAEREVFPPHGLRAFAAHRWSELGAEQRARMRDCGLLESPSRPRKCDRDDPTGHETGSLAVVSWRASTRQKRMCHGADTLARL